MMARKRSREDLEADRDSAGDRLTDADLETAEVSFPPKTRKVSSSTKGQPMRNSTRGGKKGTSSPRSSPTDVLHRLARSLVAAQKCASLEEALRELATAAVRRKMDNYRRRIRALERKYATDFDTFTARLQGRATPVEEDDWFAWRSARRMLADWQRTYQDLRHEAPRR